MDLAPYIRNMPDFPKPGIQFKDITTLLLHPPAFREVIRRLEERYRSNPPDAVAAIDARGFVFGAALCLSLDLPLVLVRKKGKLPADTVSATYDLEYGSETIEMHRDALRAGQRVLIIDDLLATGGTVAAAADLARQLGASVQEAAFVVELPPLKGRQRLASMDIPVFSLVTFMVE
ncbi:MAG TPA: adenine phosphoribosyltransferase [Candidatus Hydrogenedentes bacterium]|nr:adenine phosphoribosyltransferase [Candidatus Hydrogenedentota bacterium]